MNGIQIDVSVPSDPWMVALWIAIVIFFVLPVAAVMTAVGFWMLAKIAPIRFLLLGWMKVLAEPVRKYLGTIVREETEEIRAQVFPNGGSSMNDRLRDVHFFVQEQGQRYSEVEQNFSAFESMLIEVRGNVEDVGDNVGEISAKVEQLEQKISQATEQHERRE